MKIFPKQYWLPFVVGLSLNATAQSEEIRTLQEVTVTAKKGTDVEERRDSSAQKTIVGRKEIENMGVMTIGEVMSKLPGVEVSTGASAPRARGMTRDSVQILVDGERQSGGSLTVSGALGRLPSDDLERVEILRGSSAEFGGTAPLTINLVLKKALPKRSTEFKAGLGVRGAEPNYQFSWTKNGGEGGFGWSLPISLMWNNSPSRTAVERQSSTAGARTLWEQDSESGLTRLGHHSIAPRLTWKEGGDTLKVSPLFFYGPMSRNNYAMLDAYADPAAGTGLAYNGDRTSREGRLTRLIRLRMDGEKHLGESKLTVRAALNDNRRTLDVVRDAHDAANVLTTFTENTRSTEHEFNSALRWDRPVGLHLASFGMEHVRLARDENQSFGGSYVAQDSHAATQRESILWVQDEWSPQASFTLTGGLRAENMGLGADGLSQQHTGWLPSVAIRWEPVDKWMIRSSLGAGMKMPKVEEISNATVRSVAANTPVEADRRGNSNLRPERNVNFEAVLEHYFAEDAGVLGANLYVRSTRDFTERRVQLEGLRWVDRPWNEGDAMHWGIELDGKLRTDSLGWKNATVKAHLTLPHAQVDDVRLGIRRMARDTPRYVFSAGVDQGLPRLQSSYGISLQLSGRSETDIPGEQRSVVKARTTVDAFWLYQLTPQFKLRVSGQNLLATDSIKRNVMTAAANEWQLGTTETGYRNVMVMLEGRW